MPLLQNSIANHTIADEQVIIAIKQRDNEVMTALYDEYSCPLFSYILKILPDNALAEEVLQLVFKKLLYHIDSYNKSHGSLYVWLMNLSRNEAINHLISSYANTPALKVDAEYVKPFILKLPLLEKTIVALNYFRGLNVEDIACVLKLPVNLVVTKLQVLSVQMQLLPRKPQTV